MNNYKPEYFGKVIPVDNPSKLTDFVTNKYDAFSKIYDICKSQSSSITDIKPLYPENDSELSSLSIKVLTTKDSIESLKETIKNDATVNIIGDVITAKV